VREVKQHLHAELAPAELTQKVPGAAVGNAAGGLAYRGEHLPRADLAPVQVRRQAGGAGLGGALAGVGVVGHAAREEGVEPRLGALGSGSPGVGEALVPADARQQAQLRRAWARRRAVSWRRNGAANKGAGHHRQLSRAARSRSSTGAH
jgi:hypothetical protein